MQRREKCKQAGQRGLPQPSRSGYQPDAAWCLLGQPRRQAISLTYKITRHCCERRLTQTWRAIQLTTRIKKNKSAWRRRDKVGQPSAAAPTTGQFTSGCPGKTKGVSMSQKELGYVELEWTCPVCKTRNRAHRRLAAAVVRRNRTTCSLRLVAGAIAKDQAKIQRANNRAIFMAASCGACNSATAQNLPAMPRRPDGRQGA